MVRWAAQVFIPLSQNPTRDVAIVARTAVDPGTLSTAAHRATTVDPLMALRAE